MQGFLKQLPWRRPAQQLSEAMPGNSHLKKTEGSTLPRTTITQAVVTPAPSAPSNRSCRHCYCSKAHHNLINQSRWTVPCTEGFKWSVFRCSRQHWRVGLWLDRRTLCCLMKCCNPYKTVSAPQSCLRNREKHQTSLPDVEVILCFHSYLQLVRCFFEKVNPGVWLTRDNHYYELFLSPVLIIVEISSCIRFC